MSSRLILILIDIKVMLYRRASGAICSRRASWTHWSLKEKKTDDMIGINLSNILIKTYTLRCIWYIFLLYLRLRTSEVGLYFLSTNGYKVFNIFSAKIYDISSFGRLIREYIVHLNYLKVITKHKKS